MKKNTKNKVYLASLVAALCGCTESVSKNADELANTAYKSNRCEINGWRSLSGF